jgi:hypothetical protein
LTRGKQLERKKNQIIIIINFETFPTVRNGYSFFESTRVSDAQTIDTVRTMLTRARVPHIIMHTYFHDNLSCTRASTITPPRATIPGDSRRTTAISCPPPLHKRA